MKCVVDSMNNLFSTVTKCAYGLELLKIFSTLHIIDYSGSLCNRRAGAMTDEAKCKIALSKMYVVTALLSHTLPPLRT